MDVPLLGKRYKAFISYSKSADRRLAAALQKQLTRNARPFLSLKPYSFYRDETDLSVTPSGFSDIRKGLSQSEHLVLLASPAAAQSKWVRRELGSWLTGQDEELQSTTDIATYKHLGIRPTQIRRLLIVLTDGDIVWDDEVGDFDWTKTTALPRTLAGTFDEEPIWSDLRAFKDTDPEGLEYLDHPQHRDFTEATSQLERVFIRRTYVNRSVAFGAFAGLALLIGLVPWAQSSMRSERERFSTEIGRIINRIQSQARNDILNHYLTTSTALSVFEQSKKNSPGDVARRWLSSMPLLGDDPPRGLIRLAELVGNLPEDDQWESEIVAQLRHLDRLTANAVTFAGPTSGHASDLALDWSDSGATLGMLNIGRQVTAYLGRLDVSGPPDQTMTLDQYLHKGPDRRYFLNTNDTVLTGYKFSQDGFTEYAKVDLSTLLNSEGSTLTPEVDGDTLAMARNGGLVGALAKVGAVEQLMIVNMNSRIRQAVCNNPIDSVIKFHHSRGRVAVSRSEFSIFGTSLSSSGRYWIAHTIRDGTDDPEEGLNAWVWDLNTCEAYRLPHQSFVLGIDISEDEAWAATLGEEVRLWRLPDGLVRKSIALPSLPPGTVCTDIRFSPDKASLAVLCEKSVHIYNIETLEEVARITQPGLLTDIAFGPGGENLAVLGLRTKASGEKYGETWFWNVRTPAWQRNRFNQKSQPGSIAYIAGQNALAVSIDKEVHIYSFPDNRQLALLRAADLALDASEQISDLGAPDPNTVLIAGSSGRVWSWRWQDNKITLVKDPTENPDAVILDPSASVLSILQTFGGYPDHTYKIVLAPFGGESVGRTLSVEPRPVVVRQSFELARGGQYLAWIEAREPVSTPGTDDAGIVRILALPSALNDTPQEIQLDEAPNDATAIAFSPDARLVAAATADQLNVWRLSDGVLISTLPLDSIVSEGLMFHPNNLLVVAPGDDYKIRIYDIASRRLISKFDFDRGPIGGADLTFDAEGERLIGSFFSTPHPQSWLWEGTVLYRKLCDRLQSASGNEKWRRHLQNPRYPMAQCVAPDPH